GLLLTWVWFEPDGEQHRQGANWFRCDVKVLPGAGAASDSLPGNGLPVITGQVPDALRRCAVAGDDATTFVSCDQEHTHRWIGSAEVKGKSYPDRAGWRSRARAECRPLVGDDTFVFTYPSASDWKQGLRHLSCFRGA